MSKYYKELCAEIEQDKGIQYDEEIRKEMSDYMLRNYEN